MKKLIFILLAMAFFSCSNDDSPKGEDLSHLKTCTGNTNCDDCVIIDKKHYEATLTDNYMIRDVSVSGDCMEITFAAGGCSGSTWEEELIDMGAIAESNPVQRFLRLRLLDNEDCEAYITKTVSFNIAPLQVNKDELYLNIDGWEELVLYSY